MQPNKVTGFLGGLCLAVLLLWGGNAQAAPKKPKADVYFGHIEYVDTVNRRVSVDVYNVNHSTRRKGKFSFVIAPDASIGIEQLDGKFARNMTIHNVAESSWIWISSYDGQTTRGLTASALTSYRGTLVGAQGDTITLKLDERRMGAREYVIPDTQEPQSFQLPAKFLCRYKGKPADPSLIGQGAYLRVTTREKGGVVLVTVLDKKN